MAQQYKEDFYHPHFMYFRDFCEYFTVNLESSKKSSQAKLGMTIILLFIVFMKFILFICNKCATKTIKIN